MRAPENSRAGASAYELVIRQRVARGEPARNVPAQNTEPMFGEFAAEWLETDSRTNDKPSGYREKRITLKTHLNPAFGSRRLADITLADIEAYKGEKLRAGLCAKTVNNHLAVLSKCLSTARNWGRVAWVPKVTYFRTNSERLDYLRPEECQQLTDAGTIPMWHEMAILALRTGMRIGELLALEWNDVDFERHQVTVRRSIVRGILGTPKNGKTRHIPLTAPTEQTLQRLKRLHNIVFCRPDGTPQTYNDALHALHKVCDRAGIRRVSWHILRHTFASQLATKNVPLTAIRDLLGHSSILMTSRYAHLAPSTLQDAVALLDARA